MLGGMARKAYIGLMSSAIAPLTCFPLLAAAALVWPHDGHAQMFSADYGFSRPGAGLAGMDAPTRRTLFNLGPVRVVPALQAGTRFSSAGLSFETGRNWSAQVGLGRSVQPGLSLSNAGSNGVLSIAGGYRWSDGQSLSLQLIGGGPERLGLSASYDWPRYFVRLSYDTGLKPVPEDNLRFSAGLRF
jgi:hypothetical protein